MQSKQYPVGFMPLNIFSKLTVSSANVTLSITVLTEGF